jgi:hypothetical protein
MRRVRRARIFFPLCGDAVMAYTRTHWHPFCKHRFVGGDARLDNRTSTETNWRELS